MVRNKSNLYFFYISLTMIFVKLQFTLFMCVLCKKETSILIRYSTSTKANLALLDAIKSLCFVFYYFSSGGLRQPINEFNCFILQDNETTKSCYLVIYQLYYLTIFYQNFKSIFREISS